MRTPGILLTAPASGSGKTLITCGILQALVNRGRKTASFKCGPDYIDPMFHGKVIGTRSRNLDPFFTDADTTRYLYAKNAAGCEIAVVEGVMGYYDGLGGIRTEGSTYDAACTLDLPAVLILNCRGASLSVAATIRGFLEYRKDSHIAGVILNQISPMIYEKLRPLIEQELGIRVFGYVPKMADLSLDSRHLGLVLPGEIEALKEKLNRLARTLEETLDLNGMLACAEAYEAQAAEKDQNRSGKCPDIDHYREKLLAHGSGGPVRIAVAEDDAFCFTYQDHLELLTQMGARLVFFSPLRDRKLPGQVSGLMLSGGYPELHAEALSQNVSMRESVGRAVNQGLPCIAECGGFLYLHRELEGMDGRFYPMAGVLPARAYRTDRLGRFGYVTLEAKEDQLLGEAGTKVRGHEFHYWDSEDCGDSFHAEKPAGGREWDCVHGTRTLYAGFPHLFYYSNLQVPYRFLRACQEYQARAQGKEEGACSV